MSITAFFGSIFTDAAAKVTGAVMSGLDSLFTSDEERLKIEAQVKLAVQAQVADLEKATMSHVEQREKELTDRLRIDMAGDVWLAKNVRPLTLIGLTLFLMVLAWFTVFGDIDPKFQPVLSMWVDLFTVLDVTAFGFYFGSRGIEKVVEKLSERFGKNPPQ